METTVSIERTPKQSDFHLRVISSQAVIRKTRADNTGVCRLRACHPSTTSIVSYPPLLRSCILVHAYLYNVRPNGAREVEGRQDDGPFSFAATLHRLVGEFGVGENELRRRSLVSCVLAW